MKYETIDGEKFDCELEALRHENDILTEMCIDDRVKEKHNKQYGCYGAAQRILDRLVVDEPAKRTGIEEIDVGPEGEFELIDINSGRSKNIRGPARVLVVVD